MKATKLIEKLEKYVKEHGDFEVTYDGGYGEIYEDEVICEQYTDGTFFVTVNQ